MSPKQRAGKDGKKESTVREVQVAAKVFTGAFLGGSTENDVQVSLSKRKKYDPKLQVLHTINIQYTK